MRYFQLAALASILLFQPSGQAQRAMSVSTEFSAYVEAGGGNDGMAMASLQFDTRFKQQTAGLGIRLGMGLGTDLSNDYTVFPISLNYLFGKRRSFLETGGGFMLVFFDTTPNGPGGPNAEISPNLTLGYRYQAMKKGFTGRFFLGGAHFRGNNSNAVLIPYAGFSFGYKFLAAGGGDPQKTD